jgi:hypothetical protein
MMNVMYNQPQKIHVLAFIQRTRASVRGHYLHTVPQGLGHGMMGRAWQILGMQKHRKTGSISTPAPDNSTEAL